MGASRKLQGEIDRVLKKVQEGVDVFDSIWNKVYDTDNANQKEKFEADLKKEIKKLQRYRDQIKAWIQSSEIKDKKALMDARKQIEHEMEREMERFKICEKETKTKAFSKEGLGQQPKTDPKEKAKTETRDWLNNVVGELESQVDNFKAEIEGLSVKKGKARPPRLSHLEKSIARHKAHIMKLELILRLLDNDELSPEQVNDVKDFIDDYVERNQDDFDDFDEVDELYSSLPLEKVESLEDLVTIGPPGLVKGVGASGAVISLKASPAASPTQMQDGSPQDQVEEAASQDCSSDAVARTPPSKNTDAPSMSLASAGSLAIPATVNASSHIFSGPLTSSAILPGSVSARAVLETAEASISSSSTPFFNSAKDEEIANLPVRRPSPALSDGGVARGIGRGSLPDPSETETSPIGSGSVIANSVTLGAIPSASDVAKRNILGPDERLGSSGMIQPLISPLSSRMILPQVAKSGEGAGPADSTTVGDVAGMAGRVFSPSIVSGMQWRPGSSLQNQNEVGQFRGRTEIAPDQREKFLQRLQQVQQQGHSTLLGSTPLGGSNHKQFSMQQQNPLLQQLTSPSSPASSQAGLGLGAPASSLISASIQQNPISIPQNSSQQGALLMGQKDADAAPVKVEEQRQQQKHGDDSAAESGAVSGPARNLINEDDLNSFSVDMPAGVSSSLAEPTQVSREIDLSPGQPIQGVMPGGSLGVIGRRSTSDLGAIGDNLTGSIVSSGGIHDQLYNLQMLEGAFYKLPQPKDSERAKNYAPRHPAMTPSSYPQVQAPIVNNPSFWERLGMDTMGTDTLFFSFYYQQNTYQQYLAAKELKKQSWRYHRKYNTWFQRHEEPKVATDEYEQGTYVYFDFHMANDDLQNGWCQRIKTDFTFEYNYLEDELM